MAIFASTTTSGYSDPMKAMTIKALEKRLADQQAQNAQAGAITPENTQTPLQGFGHVANALGDSFREQRAAQAVAAQKEELARTIAGMDPNNPTPQSLAKIAVADPESYRQMLTQLAERRRQQDLFGHQDAAAKEAARVAEIARGQGYTHTDAAAAQKVLDEQTAAREKVRTDEIARGQEDTAIRARDAQKQLDAEVAAQAKFEREKSLPQTELAKLTESLGRKPTEEEVKAAVDKLTKPSALETAKVAENVRASEVAYRKGLSHIQNLGEAAQILEHPGGIYTGAMQNIAPTASGVPGVNMFVDKEKAQRTSRYNTIVGEDAIRDMAETLKGSSTNFEMQKFEKMKNDPNISDAARAAQLRRVEAAARADLEAQAKETKAIGGDTARVEKAMSGGGPATADVKEVADEAAAKALPPGTRFKLPDGRTGTTK